MHPLWKSKISLTSIALMMMLCYNSNVESKMKVVYKLQVTDHRGNRWVDYTVADPPTYISYHGGRSIIKQVRVLDYWCIQTEESLYGKSVEKIERWVPKRPSLSGYQQAANRRANGSTNQQIGRLARNAPAQQFVARQTANFSSRQRSSSASSGQLDPQILARLRFYDRLITQAAQSHRIAPELLKALVYVESAGDPRALSPKSAMGLTQLIPTTAREVGVHNVFDPQQNLHGGAMYLSEQLQTFGDEATALAAYNAGPNRIGRGRLPLETREYVAKVLAVKNMLESR